MEHRSSLQLVRSIIDARVNRRANPITGSVTAVGGTPANNVNLILSGPGGFDFDNFIARTASVNIAADMLDRQCDNPRPGDLHQPADTGSGRSTR